MKSKNVLTNLLTVLMLSVFTLTLSSCEKDPCEGITCHNDGYCDDGTCVCPSGFSGSQCENDNRPDCEKNTTGVIVFDNWSSNPYDCYVNDVYKGRVSGYGEHSVSVSAGYSSVKAIQVSGYLLYPSEYTSSGTLSKCGKMTFTFP